MIVSIKGALRKASLVSAVIETQGIGYFVHLPLTTASRLPQVGEQVELHTHVVYREDSQAIYGFGHEQERDFFALLIDKVSGVGPKVAITMMSKLELSSLVAAIQNAEAVVLAKTPGIGKKTAERVVIELKDKLSGFANLEHSGTAPSGQSGQDSLGSVDQKIEDAALALVALGYKPAEARKSVKRVVESLGESASSEALIKAALG